MKSVSTEYDYVRAVNSLTRPERELLKIYESLCRRWGYAHPKRKVLARMLCDNLEREKTYHIRTLGRYDKNLIKKGLIIKKTVTNKFDGVNKSRTVIMTTF